MELFEEFVKKYENEKVKYLMHLENDIVYDKEKVKYFKMLKEIYQKFPKFRWLVLKNLKKFKFIETVEDELIKLLKKAYKDGIIPTYFFDLFPCSNKNSRMKTMLFFESIKNKKLLKSIHKYTDYYNSKIAFGILKKYYKTYPKEVLNALKLIKINMNYKENEYRFFINKIKSITKNKILVKIIEEVEKIKPSYKIKQNKKLKINKKKITS